MLDLVLNIIFKKPIVSRYDTVCLYIPATQEAKAGGSFELWSLRFRSNIVRPHLKKKLPWIF
jgi:hypothetical protein